LGASLAAYTSGFGGVGNYSMNLPGPTMAYGSEKFTPHIGGADGIFNSLEICAILSIILIRVLC
jgi:hypothetical protein